jgi:hypothetical protein
MAKKVLVVGASRLNRSYTTGIGLTKSHEMHRWIRSAFTGDIGLMVRNHLNRHLQGMNTEHLSMRQNGSTASEGPHEKASADIRHACASARWNINQPMKDYSSVRALKPWCQYVNGRKQFNITKCPASALRSLAGICVPRLVKARQAKRRRVRMPNPQ